MFDCHIANKTLLNIYRSCYYNLMFFGSKIYNLDIVSKHFFLHNRRTSYPQSNSSCFSGIICSSFPREIVICILYSNFFCKTCTCTLRLNYQPKRQLSIQELDTNVFYYCFFPQTFEMKTQSIYSLFLDKCMTGCQSFRVQSGSLLKDRELENS